MKKTILSFLLMFVTMATFASRWTAPEFGKYSDRFVVYTQVNINGLPRSQGVEVAAFIDGQVRGVLMSPILPKMVISPLKYGVMMKITERLLLSRLPTTIWCISQQRLFLIRTRILILQYLSY